MRVGFDVTPITNTRTGVGNYCFYLLKHLLELDAAASYHAFSSGRAEIDLNGLASAVTHRHFPLPTRAAYALWNTLGVPKVDVYLGGVDVFHGTNYFLPPVRNARTVVTIHDLAFLAVPEFCSPKIVGPFSKSIRRFAHAADAVMAYSESTKNDIVNLLEVEPDKITVAPMAVDEGFAAMPKDEAETRVKNDYGVDTPFLLFVSTLEPRKNVVGLLRAFARMKDDIPHNLVMIGSVGWNAEPIFDAIRELGLEDRIVRPGFVPHMELPAFYCAADAFVFPTHYEGFGLPLLEALTCGCPVVSARNSAVPEIVGDAALLVDSQDEQGLADAVLKLLNDESLKSGLVAKGKVHAQRFSWRACAQSTLAVYQRIVT